MGKGRMGDDASLSAKLGRNGERAGRYGDGWRRCMHYAEAFMEFLFWGKA